MKVSLTITEKQRKGGYGTFQPDKVETVTLADITDAEMGGEALVGILRAIADSLDPNRFSLDSISEQA